MKWVTLFLFNADKSLNCYINMIQKAYIAFISLTLASIISPGSDLDLGVFSILFINHCMRFPKHKKTETIKFQNKKEKVLLKMVLGSNLFCIQHPSFGQPTKYKTNKKWKQARAELCQAQFQFN